MFETLYNKIISLDNFSPNIHTNEIFSSLYNGVISGKFAYEYCENKKHTVQNICAQAEYEMEKYYAENIMNGNIDLKDFPYLKNYEKLTLQETNFIKNVGVIPKKILYIGGGPLPLSVIYYAKFTNAHITVLDNSLEAIMLGKKIIEKLGFSHQITYEYGDANTFISQEKYDVVSVASLVFTQSNIENILANLQKISFDLLHLRSAQGARELLYKKLPTDILEKYFKILFQHHPKDEIINSVILLKKYE